MRALCSGCRATGRVCSQCSHIALDCRIAREFRKRVSLLHPGDPFSNLDLMAGRQKGRVIERSRLHIDDARQDICVTIEQSCSKVATELPSAILR